MNQDKGLLSLLTCKDEVVMSKIVIVSWLISTQNRTLIFIPFICLNFYLKSRWKSQKYFLTEEERKWERASERELKAENKRIWSYPYHLQNSKSILYAKVLEGNLLRDIFYSYTLYAMALYKYFLAGCLELYVSVLHIIKSCGNSSPMGRHAVTKSAFCLS